MKYYIILSLAALFCCNAFCQTQMDNWVFGDSAGLNFNTVDPTIFHSKIRSLESAASISDSLGNLLFYTNGQSIWNKENDVMTNGDSLNIGGIAETLGLPSTITQGVIILPMPGSFTKYYVIYNTNFNSPPDPSPGLEYSIVDMAASGGLGSVISKNVELYSGFLWEKMQAVKHGNGNDWWLLVHSNEGFDTAMCFVRFLITNDSIEGPFFQCFDSTEIGTYGQMKISLNGDKLAFTRLHGLLSLYNFDRCTGLLDHPQEINCLLDYGLYGSEFSASGNMLYIGDGIGLFNPGLIYQFCLSCPGPIESTIDTIFNCNFTDHTIGQLQIGPNNKIYITTPLANVNTGEYTTYNTSISFINQPEIDGIGCNFDTLKISFEDARCTYALPNMPNYSLGPLTGSQCDTLLSINNFVPPSINIYPNPASEQLYVAGNIAYASSQIELHIYNLLGEEVFYKEQIPFNSAIELPSLSNGLYEAVLENGKTVLFKGKLEIYR